MGRGGGEWEGRGGEGTTEGKGDRGESERERRREGVRPPARPLERGSRGRRPPRQEDKEDVDIELYVYSYTYSYIYTLGRAGGIPPQALITVHFNNPGALLGVPDPLRHA